MAPAAALHGEYPTAELGIDRLVKTRQAATLLNGCRPIGITPGTLVE